MPMSDRIEEPNAAVHESESGPQRQNRCPLDVSDWEMSGVVLLQLEFVAHDP